jgi:hypothetical protein
MTDNFLIRAERDALAGALARREAIRVEINELNKEDRELREWIDKLRLANRPSYPTANQRAGIVEAVRRIKANVNPGSHLGDVVADDNSVHVGVLHNLGWMTIDTLAARSQAGGDRLWSFSSKETKALLKLVEAEGVKVTNWWPTAQGLALQTDHRHNPTDSKE